MNTPLFSLLLLAHLLSLIVGFGAVVVIDSFGLLWLLKVKAVTLSLVTQVARVTQVLIWIGFSGLVVSGIPLLYLKGSVDNLTKLKLFLVVMVGLNGVFLHFIKKSMEKLGLQNTVTPVIQFRMSVASTISQVGWWGAIIIGFYHNQVNHNVLGFDFWHYLAIGTAFIVGLVVLVGELKFKK